MTLRRKISALLRFFVTSGTSVHLNHHIDTNRTRKHCYWMKGIK